MDYTIAETFTLPSEGKIYSQKVNPQVQLRSMTTEEEMRRLAHTETPYKNLCDIIDNCMVEPIGISSYDLHLGDYQYLLHRLRVVTYGNQYPSTSICPFCGKSNKIILNLDDIPVIKYEGDIKEDLEFDLPRTGKHIKIKFQTPRDIDEICKEEVEYNNAHPDATINISYLLSLRHIIDTVDGKKSPPAILDPFLRRLPAMDSNLILQKATKINEKVGIDTSIKNKCTNPKCGAKYNTTFRISNEFFGPTIY